MRAPRDTGGMVDEALLREAKAVLRKRFPLAEEAAIEAEVRAVALRIRMLAPAGRDAEGRAYVAVTALAGCFGVAVEDLADLLALIPPCNKRLCGELQLDHGASTARAQR